MATTPPSANYKENSIKARFLQSNLARVFSYGDFRLLWIGAFLSFTGSQIQNVAQGHFVYRLTQDESKLAFVSFCGSFPVFLLGFVAGTLADAFDKRIVLIITQAIFAIGAIYLAIVTYLHVVQYWQIAAIAGILGFVSCVEMPTRQSIVSRVVPAEILASAVPVNAMTFNLARILGPAMGALLLLYCGVAMCYLLNGISFLALIWAALAIKSNLKSYERREQSIRDLVMEGMVYTMRDKRLRTLLFLEIVTTACGLAYLPMMPAYVHQILKITPEAASMMARQPNAYDPSKALLGACYTAVGVGAIAGLLLVTQYAKGKHKAAIVQYAMWTIGIGLLILSVAHDRLIIFPTLLLMGSASVAQLNTTNALFQLISPERLRGRVLAMHIWAINGFSPFGVLLFGWIASQSRIHQGEFSTLSTIPLFSTGVTLSMQLGGLCVVTGAICASLSRQGLANLP